MIEICVDAAYLISFKPERKNSCNLHITGSFSYRRNDVSFMLQLIRGDAIFVKVFAVNFSSSFAALMVLTKLKTTTWFPFCNRTNIVLWKKYRIWEPSKIILLPQLTIALFVFIAICIFRRCLHGQAQQQKLCTGEKLRFEQIVMCTVSQQRWIKKVSLTKLGVPKLSLAMYPFSISIDERILLKQYFSNFLFHSPPYTLDTRLRPPSLIKHTQGSKFKYFYLMEILNSWTKLLNSLIKQLYCDANITFRILVKIIHTVAGHTHDPE